MGSKQTDYFDSARAQKLLEEVLNEAVKFIIKNLPRFKHLFEHYIDVIFTPKAIAKQVLLAMALETGAMTAMQLYRIVRTVSSRFSSHSRLISQLERRQLTAETQDEWMSLAEQIDAIQRNDKWRSEPGANLYEPDRVSARIDELVHLMRRRDIFDLIFTLRGGIARNKFGLLHEGLFSRALAGTKVLVETYQYTICASLDFVCDAPVLPGEDPIPTDARLAFFNETRHAYGRTALMFSRGAALGFYHLGVAKTLVECGLMPRVLSGSIAGSIVCAMIGTRTIDECLNDLFEVKGTNSPGHSGRIKLDFFRPIKKEGDMDASISEVYTARRIRQLLFPASLRDFVSYLFDLLRGKSKVKDVLMSDTEHFRECCRVNIGTFTFQEAFDRTGRILNITVSPTNRSDPPRLLNYLTAPHVLVWSAAVASSSLPGVFESNRLLVKDADGSERFESSTSVRFADGSLENDLPMQQLSEMFSVNHFIISPVNPHAVMFSSLGLNQSVWTNALVGAASGLLLFVKNQIKSWIRNFVDLIGGSRQAPVWETKRGFLTQFFTQEYVGRDVDITLNPWAGHRSLLSSFFCLLYNPTDEELRIWVKAAESETWKYIPRLKSHCAVEMTLDRCVQRLRRRIVQESYERRSFRSAEVESTQSKIGDRVPSFYTSASLVNLGGLNAGDQATIPDLSIARKDEFSTPTTVENSSAWVNGQSDFNHFEIGQGWGGMGLRGNISSGNLHRQDSNSSAFFWDEDEEEEENKHEVKTLPIPKHRHLSIEDVRAAEDHGYVKTSSMANFYYRKVQSQNDFSQHHK